MPPRGLGPPRGFVPVLQHQPRAAAWSRSPTWVLASAPASASRRRVVSVPHVGSARSLALLCWARAVRTRRLRSCRRQRPAPGARTIRGQIPRLHLPARASKRRAQARGRPLRMRADADARARVRAQPWRPQIQRSTAQRRSGSMHRRGAEAVAPLRPPPITTEAVRDATYVPTCTSHLAPCTLHLAPCTLHLAPCTLHHAPRTTHLAPRTTHLAPRTLLLIPS
jgi:hypothetical protein